MNCPHCHAALVEHTEQNAKQGAQHCYGCGCCFLADGKTVRIQTCDVIQHAVLEAPDLPVEPQPAPEPPRRRR